MRIAILEPHLGRYGGIRRMLEFANRLTDRGHDVTFALPPGEALRCDWTDCRAGIRRLADAADEAFDIVLFNDEPQWHLLDHFTAARRRVFYALHDGTLYGKRGSWDAAYAAVDLQLANSAWTADRIAERTGHRPTVQLGGIDRDLFSPPVGAPPFGDQPRGDRPYPLLCVGDDEREWKGTDTIRAAAARLRLDLEGYAHKDLPQAELGDEYRSARQFVVGSWFEGFGQPGLEALACGTPLVTTDNGGAAEYARNEETALVVPPPDEAAMAAAIERLDTDEDLARRLATNGLDLVAEDFDWDARTDELAERLDGVVADPGPAPPRRPEPPDEPTLSVIVLAWDNLPYTQAFVESVRLATDVDHELIIVDNGSAAAAADYARAAADRAVLNPDNVGFAAGMNQGLTEARGRFVAFCNNDTILPEGWASRLTETATDPAVGIAVPAVTAAGNPVTVRTAPSDAVHPLDPFSAPPSAVIVVMRRDLAVELGGWNEDYPVASGEDVDLGFVVWTNDLDIVLDERVLVEHEGKASARRLDDWTAQWAANRRRFLERWTGEEDVPRLQDCPPDRHARNRATARAAAGWMARFFAARDERRGPISRIRARLTRQGWARTARRWWHRHQHRLPSRVRRAVRTRS